MTVVFLHGLDSSSQGTKARWFRQHFPAMVIPDFTGNLERRMVKLTSLLSRETDLVIIGSSFGGLMATIYAQQHEKRVSQVVLLAPALNFPEFESDVPHRVNVPTHLYIGQRDTVCPPNVVIPIARQVYADLTICLSNDDHMLRDTFFQVDWTTMLDI